jgi:hypothetical protein
VADTNRTIELEAMKIRDVDLAINKTSSGEQQP